MLNRELGNTISQELKQSDKVIIIFGARQVGKTTLSNKILNEINKKTIKINGDNLRQIEVFEKVDLQGMLELIDNAEVLFIDEAQNIINIGKAIKLLHDEKPEIKIILTGSSSFEIANKTQESLAGRKSTFTLYPLSIQEIRKEKSIYEIKENLHNILKYGLYPEVFSIQSISAKEKALLELTDAFLFKDILQLSNIKNPRVLRDLLKLLALQIGQTVSISKLSNALNVANDTILNYIDLLEKSYVIYRLRGYSKNLSKEISKMDKILFYDVGVRNAVLNQFMEINERSDIGKIWENFIISERIKSNSNNEINCEYYFWRTYTGAEIDLIEENGRQTNAFEIKYNNKLKSAPSTWTQTYPKSEFFTINTQNWTDFVLK